MFLVVLGCADWEAFDRSILLPVFDWIARIRVSMSVEKTAGLLSSDASDTFAVASGEEAYVEGPRTS